ncbi:MAG: flavin reductase [Devosia sp.]|nr:flavin reductase [Devosia sp.]
MMAAPIAEAEPSTRQAFLEAMAQMATSVSIVATDGPAGRDGVVVSALASVSADAPRPLLLICLHQAGRVPEKLLANGVFSVNLLGEQQRHLADRFAGRSALPREHWFAEESWTRRDTGAPVLTPALASFDCSVSQTSLVGTHFVIFGAVCAIHSRADDGPLVHAQRRYRRLHD